MKISQGWNGALAVVMALLSACAPAQISKSGSGFRFRLKYSSGENLRYRMESVLVNPAGNNHTAGPLNFHVLSVRNGISRVQANLGPFKAEGQPVPAQTYKVQVDALGRVLSSSPVTPGAEQLFFRLPAKAISVGQSWTTETRVTILGGDTRIKSLNKLVGFKNLNGHRVAVIEIAINGTGETDVLGGGTAFLLATDGTLLSTTTNIKMTYNNGERLTSVLSKLHLFRQ